MEVLAIASKIEDKVKQTLNGASSTYFTFENTDTDEIWTVRISNHMANPQRVGENTISFVVRILEDETEDRATSWGVRKKEFKNITNQFFLDENGEFEETFEKIESCIDYILN